MQKQQIKFTCDQLRFNEVKTNAIIDVMINGCSSYSVEAKYTLPKGTVSRDCNRVKAKWHDMRDVSNEIQKLKYEYEPAVLDEDINRATKALHEAIEQIDGYQEGDFGCIEELKATVLQEVRDAIRVEFKQ
jgi:hypothetical protein